MAAKRSVRVFVGEIPLTCPLCRHDLFTEREIKLNTAGMSLLGLDWANQAANGFICLQCGRIEMFLDNGSLRLAEA